MRAANAVNKLPKAESHLELTLRVQLRALGLPEPVLQHRLVPGRRFRADLAWPAALVYVECEGGIWVGGRHGTGSGIESDSEKTSLAALEGYRLIRCTRSQIESGEAASWIERALREEAP